MSDEGKRDRTFSDEEAEKIRKRYKYRKLIQTGKLRLPHKDATALLGPDTAYHLYGLNGYTAEKLPEKKKSAKQKRKK
jgi:hypothetical protein